MVGYADFVVDAGAGVVAIPLREAFVALADLDDLAVLRRFAWMLQINRKRRHGLERPAVVCQRAGKREAMSRVLLEANPQEVIVFGNEDPLDNRRENLIRCGVAEARWATRARRGGSSPFKGVSWDADRQLWDVRICTNGRVTKVGRFACEEEAARAYDLVARDRGPWARVNFPLPGEHSAIAPDRLPLPRRGTDGRLLEP